MTSIFFTHPPLFVWNIFILEGVNPKRNYAPTNTSQLIVNSTGIFKFQVNATLEGVNNVKNMKTPISFADLYRCN